jgi:hypothetical protein
MVSLPTKLCSTIEPKTDIYANDKLDIFLILSSFDERRGTNGKLCIV